MDYSNSQNNRVKVNKMIKIREYKARQYGERGVQLSLPQVFLDDNGIESGDTLEIYRTNLEDGSDALVILPKNKKPTVNIENAVLEISN